MIEDLESVWRIELYHEDIPVFVHIDIVRGQPVQARKFYWNNVVITDEWITTSVAHFENEIQDRTTWNDGRHFSIGLLEKWDHPIRSIEPKLAAYQRSGYQIAEIRRRNE